MTKTSRGRLERPSLKRAVAFESQDIIDGFIEKFGVTSRAAQDVFLETKKFLWLLAITKQRDVQPFITDHILVIDEMWHTFVLYSPEYRQYCAECFGEYLDHAPTTKMERRRAAKEYRRDPEGTDARWGREFRAALELIYERLGRGTVLKWYTVYPRKYSRTALEDMRHRQALARKDSK